MPDRNPYRRRRSRRPGPGFHGHREPSQAVESGDAIVTGVLLISGTEIEFTFNKNIADAGTAWNQLHVNGPTDAAYGTTVNQTGPQVIVVSLANDLTGGNGTWTIDGPTGMTFEDASFQVPAAGHYVQDF